MTKRNYQNRTAALDRLRHHVTGAIERGETEPIIGVTAAPETATERDHLKAVNADKFETTFFELLAALQAIAGYPHADHGGTPTIASARTLARAAIAKATGD